MPRLRPLAAALLAAALATGCGGGADDGKDARTGAPASASQSPELTSREAFLLALEDAEIESWATEGPTDDEIAEFPEKWCRAASVGHSVPWMLEGDGSDELYPVGWEWGTTLSDARQVVIMGIGATCPELRSDALMSMQNGSTDY